MQRTIPVLRIEDYETAKSHYVDWLGFAIDWEFRFGAGFPVYMQISRDGLLLHLTEHKGDCDFGGLVHVDVDDIDALWREWNAKRPEFDKRPELAPWNAMVMRIGDPFGNKLAINQALPESGGSVEEPHS
ncbi:MAG TPA: glyoxalase superfamily protein [Tepidisphaeraceae bacterium]